MEKLSSKDIQELLEAAAPTIRKLASERDALEARCQRLERRDEAEKVASAIRDKGIDTDTPFETLVAHMEKAAEQGKLDQIRASVEMVGPDMGTKIAQLTNTDDARISAGSSDLERFIFGGVG